MQPSGFSPFQFIVRIFLFPFALIYGAIVWLRNRLYDSGFFSSVRFSVPLISVGNLSAGGTGKTPHVEYLVGLLRYRYQLATMSRGYKRRTQGFLIADETANALKIGDEPMQYHMKFPELTVCVAEERVTGIPSLLQRRPGTEVLILDDAYQHRSVKPGLNLLITDFAFPYFKDHILPYGRLRESRKAAARADIIVVSKCPADLSRETAAEFERNLEALPHQQVYFSTIQYGSAYDVFTLEPVPLSGAHLVLVAGIAKPEPLLRYLKEQGNEVHLLSYPDHHYFYSKDLEEIRQAYDRWEVPHKAIVTTEKDAVRLMLFADQLKAWDIRILAIPISVRFLLDREAAFDEQIGGYAEAALVEYFEY